MTITLQAVNELIASLESAGELSIRETKVMALAKAYQQLAAENVGLNEQVRALAADNSALINSSVCTLQDGRPLHGFYASEWFIAKLKNGEYAALKALPEEYSYDYRTNDGTYYTKDWVVGWMQTPDTEYRPNVKTPATDRIVAGIKADGRVEGAHFVANRMLAAWDAGFIEDTAKNAADIARMILTSTEFMADAPEGDFDRSFADGILEDIAQQMRVEAK